MRSVNTVSKSVSRGVRSRTLGETLELDLRGLLITLIEAVNTSGPPAMHGRHWMARSRRSRRTSELETPTQIWHELA